MDKLVRIFSTLDDLYQTVADHYAEVVRRAVQSRGEAYVALSGGGCPGYLTHPFGILGFSMQILPETGSVY